MPPVFGFPLLEGGGIDAVALPGLVDEAADIRLFQNANNFRLGEIRLVQENLLAGMAIVLERSPCNRPSQILASLRYARSVTTIRHPGP